MCLAFKVQQNELLNVPGLPPRSPTAIPMPNLELAQVQHHYKYNYLSVEVWGLRLACVSVQSSTWSTGPRFVVLLLQDVGYYSSKVGSVWCQKLNGFKSSRFQPLALKAWLCIAHQAGAFMSQPKPGRRQEGVVNGPPQRGAQMDAVSGGHLVHLANVACVHSFLNL